MSLFTALVDLLHLIDQKQAGFELLTLRPLNLKVPALALSHLSFGGVDSFISFCDKNLLIEKT